MLEQGKLWKVEFLTNVQFLRFQLSPSQVLKSQNCSIQ